MEPAKTLHPSKTHSRKLSKRLRVISALTLFSIGIVLALVVVYKNYFSSLTVVGYLLTAWDAVSLWTGRIATIAGVVIPVIVFLRKRNWPVERSWKQLLAELVGRIPRLASPRIFFPGLIGVALIDSWLLYAVLAYNSPFPMPPSTIVITPDGSEIYVCDENGGLIRRFDSATGKNELPSIDVGGHPRRMLVGPRSGDIYVLDSQGSRVVVINPKTEAIVYALTYLGHVSNSFALTPDERKLYISNEQPSPQATVTVVDLKRSDHETHSIEGFNCPEGLAIVPDGSKVYVSTQCGAQHDPIFIIESRTDRIKKAIVDFAVGTADLAVAKQGKRVYVSRGMSRPEGKSGNVLNVPAQISSIDTARDEKVEAEALDAGGAFAVTPNGKFLLFAHGPSIEIVNSETRATRSITVGLPISGIAVGKPNRKSSTLVCYAWCKDRNFIFFTGLTGLLP